MLTWGEISMQDFIKQEELTAEQSQIINLKFDSNYVIQVEH